MRVATIKDGKVQNVILVKEIPVGCIASNTAQIGDTVVNGVIVPKPVIPPMQNYKGHATRALNMSDTTILRCIEHNMPVPSAWATYRAALRVIAASGIGPLPTQPAFPI